MSMKWLAGVVLAIALAFGAGWLTAASSRSLFEQQRDSAEVRADFANVRVDVLEGRVSLYQSNFGEAVQHFQDARAVIGRLQAHFREIRQVEPAGRLEVVTSHLHDAEHLTGLFDPHAQDAAVEALKALDALVGS